MIAFNKLTTALLISVLCAASVVAQSIPQLAVFDNVGYHSGNDHLQLSWTNLAYEDADYFLVEKLDENWEYVAVGKVKASPLEVIYSIEDEQAVLGENYYRITVITEAGNELISELLIGDYLLSDETNALLDSQSLIAKQKMNSLLEGSELALDNKYSKHQLQLARIKSTVSFSNNYSSTLVASVSFLD